MLEAAPAPDWTRTSFFAASFLTVSGVAATRVSPARTSAGTPILMRDISWIEARILHATADEGALRQLEQSVHRQGERRRGERAGEQGNAVVEREPLRDALAEASCADEGGDGRGSHADNCGSLDSREEGRKSERQFDHLQDLPPL